MPNLSPQARARVDELTNERKQIEKEEAATTDPDVLQELLRRLHAIKEELDGLLRSA